jgi:hypothetical protein
MSWWLELVIRIHVSFRTVVQNIPLPHFPPVVWHLCVGLLVKEKKTKAKILPVECEVLQAKLDDTRQRIDCQAKQALLAWLGTLGPDACRYSTAR